VTRFIPSFATQQILPPWTAQCDVYGMVFDVAEAFIAGYADRFFNNVEPPAALRLGPVPDCNFGVVLFSRRYDARSSQSSDTFDDTGDRSWDDLSFTEVSINLPMQMSGVNPVTNVALETPSYLWCQPLIAVNNSTIRSTLREILGLDVLPARFNETPLVAATTPQPGDGSFQPADPVLHKLSGDAFSLNVQIPGVEAFAPTSKEGWVDFMEVVFPAAGAGYATARPGDASFADAIHRMAGGDVIGPGGAVPATMDYIALKQFRDAYDMESAVYQAVVRSVVICDPSCQCGFLPADQSFLRFTDNATTNEIVTRFLGQDGVHGVSPDGLQSGPARSVFHLQGPISFGKPTVPVVIL
jgi:hypothetical protein